MLRCAILKTGKSLIECCPKACDYMADDNCIGNGAHVFGNVNNIGYPKDGILSMKLPNIIIGDLRLFAK